MSARALGVGIIGAGPVTQAIHLPTLARMPELFDIVNVMDVSAQVAETVAGSAGARASTSLEELLADPDVDVVAVCSPPQFHAQQVIAAMEAGKKAVLCEKPLATSPEEASAIAEASERYGVPVLVGAMHVFDPGWVAALEEWSDLAHSAHTVRSRMMLAPNERFEDLATEVLARPQQHMGQGGDPIEQMKGMISALVLGLTVHDLPLIRRLLGEAEDVRIDSTLVLAPFGYLISGDVGGRALEMVGAVNGHWESCWELEAVSDDAVLTVRFTPSFVHAGSAVATIRRADGTSRVFGPFAHNGYENEWQALHRVVGGDASAAPATSEFLDDLAFILAVAERSVEAIGKDSSS